jgi:transcriptional regulator with XRE-family HTH domain
MLTELGKFLRHLRINLNELLGEMAEKLEVSPSMLSSVETGRKNMPVNWNEKIPKLYNLNSDETKKFKELAIISANKISMDLKNTKIPHKDLAFQFARKFHTLDD